MIVIHGIEEMRKALTLGQEPTLVSPPAAVGFHGIGWWQALVSQARIEFPHRQFTAVLDCSGMPGLALAAIRLRVGPIWLRGVAPEVGGKVVEIGQRAGIRVELAEELPLC